MNKIAFALALLCAATACAPIDRDKDNVDSGLDGPSTFQMVGLLFADPDGWGGTECEVDMDLVDGYGGQPIGTFTFEVDSQVNIPVPSNFTCSSDDCHVEVNSRCITDYDGEDTGEEGVLDLLGMSAPMEVTDPRNWGLLITFYPQFRTTGAWTLEYNADCYTEDWHSTC
jgi:hypothetical protein